MYKRTCVTNPTKPAPHACYKLGNFPANQDSESGYFAAVYGCPYAVSTCPWDSGTATEA